MIYDDFHCARIATRPTGAVLQQVGIPRLLLPWMTASFLLAVAGLMSAALPSLRFLDAPGWKSILGLLLLALFAGVFIVFPMWGAAELVGQRYEYVFDRFERQLLAHSRWFGVVLRSRRYGFDRFQRVCVRLEIFRGSAMTRSWWFTVSCEGEGVSLRLVGCTERQRAVELAGAIAAQIALPVQDQCDD